MWAPTTTTTTRNGRIVKRSPLKRNTPLRRGKAMRKKIPRRVLRMTDEDRAYRAWIHTQPCCGRWIEDWNGVVHQCDGAPQQSHERNHTGLGLKAPERRSVAMCSSLHAKYEAQHVSAVNWMNQRIAEANARFDARAE